MRKSLCLAALLWLAAVPGLAQRSPGFLHRSAADLQGEYGKWRVVVTEHGASGAKSYRILSADLGITVVVSPAADRPLFLRTSRPGVPGASLTVRVDGRRPLALGPGAEGSPAILRQMLSGRKLVVEHDAWPSGERTRAEASLEGFADAWRAAQAMVREPRSVRAYLYEPCDDDFDCQVSTFCETGSPYCSAVTSTCQCTEGEPGGGGGGGGSGGGCQGPYPCGPGQTWSDAACFCVCVENPGCPEGQSWDPIFCQCACPNVQGCMPPKEWNSGTCTCTCPAGSPDPSSCTGFTEWNDDTCRCDALLPW